MEDFKYCPMCRCALSKRVVEGRERPVCGDCGWVDYHNPLPVASCLVKNSKGEILLIQRGVEPCKGCWALPGGFIEVDESIPEAGKRELLEETGLEGVPGRIIGAYAHESPMYRAILGVGIEYTVKNENITVGDDARDAKFFPLETLPDIPFPHHRKLIQEFSAVTT